MSFCGHRDFSIPKDNQFFSPIINVTMSLAVNQGAECRPIVDELLSPIKGDCELLMPALYTWVAMAHEAHNTHKSYCANDNCPGFNLDTSEEALDTHEEIRNLILPAASFVSDVKWNDSSDAMLRVHSAYHRLDELERENFMYLLLANSSEYIKLVLTQIHERERAIEMLATEKAEESLRNVNNPGDIPGIRFDL